MRSSAQSATALLLAIAACAQSSPELRIKILEGDGQVFRAGQTSSKRVTVEIADASGQPASGVAVTFKLAAGRFASGLASEVLLTGADGKATIYGIHWDEQPGPAAIEVVAVSGTLRAELEIPVEIAAATGGERLVATSGTSKKWLWISLAVAGAAGGGLFALRGQNTTTAGAGPVAPGPSTLPGPPQVGPPTITIGKP